MQQTYVEKILNRFVNPHLPDTAEHVGRSSLCKISRTERFVGPAAELAETGRPVDGLMAAVGALLAFDVAEDAESAELQTKLEAVKNDDADLTATITELTGIETNHPLYQSLEAQFKAAIA